MKLFNFKSFPFFCCLFGLSIPNTVYCKAEVDSGSVESKKDVKTAETVKKGTGKKAGSSTKKVSAETKTEEKQNGKKAEERKTQASSVKSEEESKPEPKKEVVKKNAPAKKGEVKKEEDKKVVKEDQTKATEVKNNPAPKKEDEKKSSARTRRDAVKKQESKRIVEGEKNVVAEKKEEAVVPAEEHKKELEKKSETTTKENLKEENSASSNNRRSRRGEEGASQKKAEEDKEDKKDSEDKKEGIKNERRRERRKRGEKIDKKVEEEVSIADEQEVEEEENFVGISSSDYLKQLNSLVEAYSGKANQIVDIRSKLSGRNLEVYNEIYKPYDVNGNQKLKKHDIQFKNQLVRRIDLKEKVNLPFFRSNKEITKFFLEGIKEGRLVAFFDPFLSQRMTPELLREQLLMPRDVEAVVESDSEPMQELLFDPHDVSVMELISNWIFDKNTSDFSEDPNLIKLIIPADKFADTTKIQRVVCFIRYADAVDFLKKSDDATWIDDQNEAVELSIGEAFSMTLFNSYITSVGNRDCNNGDVKDKWGVREGDPSYASRKAEDFKCKFEGSLDSI